MDLIFLSFIEAANNLKSIYPSLPFYVDNRFFLDLIGLQYNTSSLLSDIQ